MAKREKEEKYPSGHRQSNKNGKERNGKDKPKDSILSNWTKRWIKAILLFLVAVIIVLSFPSFNKAGYAGEIFAKVCQFLIGRGFYTIPLFLFIAGLIFFKKPERRVKIWQWLLAVFNFSDRNGRNFAGYAKNRRMDRILAGKNCLSGFLEF